MRDLIGIVERLNEGVSRKRAFSFDQLDGSAYFSKQALEYAFMEAESPLSRCTLIAMSPAEFLAMAERLATPVEAKSARVADALEKGLKFSDVPFLTFCNNGDGIAAVVGHEGRHRMMALAEIGVTQVPVLFKSMPGDGKSIRWGSDREFDIVDPWPTVLLGETMGRMPMPESLLYRRQQNVP